jgi:hypothetical protein
MTKQTKTQIQSLLTLLKGAQSRLDRLIAAEEDKEDSAILDGLNEALDSTTNAIEELESL